MSEASNKDDILIFIYLMSRYFLINSEIWRERISFATLKTQHVAYSLALNYDGLLDPLTAGTQEKAVSSADTPI